MVEEVGPLYTQQQRCAFEPLDPALYEHTYILCCSAAECRLRNHLAVHYRPVIIRAVSIVIDARRGVERAGRRELHQRAGRDVERKVVAQRDHRTMPLIEHARTALHFTESCDIAVV